MAEMAVGSNVLLISAEGSDEASLLKTMDRWKPDIVALEFCDKRAEVVFETEELKQVKILDIFTGGELYTFIGQMLYHSVYTDIETTYSQFRNWTLTAKEEAERRGIEVKYIDQGIDILVKRAWRQVPLKEKWGLFNFYRRKLFRKKDAPRDVEKADPIYPMINQLVEASPSSENALVTERTEHLALSILDIAKEKKVLAVVGSDHMEEIGRQVSERQPDPERKEALETYPKKVKISLYRWILVAAIISFFAYKLYNDGVGNIAGILLWWSIATSLGAAAGAIISRAHALTILAAVVSAPLMSFTGMGAGWVAGIVEVKIRSPKVEDFMELGNMPSRLNLFKNKCTKPIAVGAITNLANWTAIALFFALS